MIESGVFLLLTYLVASIPTGPILAALYADVDVTLHGSGNIGATNVHRVLGAKFGGATLAGDLAKGCIPVLLAPMVSDTPWFPGVVAITAFIGHCWSAYLEFRGGKGVATAAGALLALSPLVALFTAMVWMVTFLTIKRSSVAALAATAALPVLAAWLQPDQLWVCVVLALGVLQRHRDNIDRLLSGYEPPNSS